MVDRPPDLEERPATNRISISISGVDLPTDQDTRENLLDKLEGDVEKVADENGLSVSETSVRTGHQYPEITPDCPRCGNTLALPRSFTIEDKLTSTTGMSIVCRECGYGGGATYRLVDIATNKLIPDRPPHKQAERYRSEVADGNISPEYSTYHD